MKWNRLAFCLLFFILLGLTACDDTKPKGTESDRTKNQKQRSKSLTASTVTAEALKESIDKSVAFLASEFEQVNSNNYVLMHFLQRKFDVDLGLSHERAVNTLGADNYNKYTLRYIDPEKKMTEPEITVAKLVYLGKTSMKNPNGDLYADLLRALYCQNIPLEQDLIDRIAGQTAKGGQHAILSARLLSILSANSCGSDNQLEPHKIACADELIKMIERDDGGSMASAGSISYLYLLDAGDRVKEQWIADIMARQSSNGDWSKETSIRHAENVVSLHCLLEYAFPEKVEPYVAQ